MAGESLLCFPCGKQDGLGQRAMVHALLMFWALLMHRVHYAVVLLQEKQLHCLLLQKRGKE